MPFSNQTLIPGRQRGLCKFFYVFFFLSLVHFEEGAAQGIKGYVRDEAGNPLAFATIFVKRAGTGTTTNENGFYEIALDSGRNEIVFQFLGYETQVRVVEIDNEIIELNLNLKPQTTVLPTVVVQDGDEDP